MALDGAGPQAAIQRRLERWWPDVMSGLQVYAGRTDPDLLEARVLSLVERANQARRPALKALDEQRQLRPDWFQEPRMLGYVAYADRFAGTLKGVGERIGYLRELGVSYLHLMPLLEPRPGPDDGGYAVRDYRSVRADLGTVADLSDLADALHQNGIALTLDLVLNHVAQEHDWARAAARGEEPYRSFFHVFADRAQPDAYEATLPEVFPDFAPGSFSWHPEVVTVPGQDPQDPATGRGAWVWTTFNTFQWDLDWSNPDVFCAMLEVVLDLLNLGVDVLRLDAIAFIWKRLGTSCQNQPEVHDIVQALRAAVRIAAPGALFKAEAIVAPEDLPAYLGSGAHSGKVCDLAYHNSLMVQLWSGLAARDARLARRALAAAPPKPLTTSWTTYARCHDDIGWAISDTDAAALGVSGAAHRAFLSDFYSGAHPHSWARGAVFQVDPGTGSGRTSGTLASLAGLEAALAGHSPRMVDLALGRIFLLHAAIYGYGGIPLLYMGDELGQLNDHGYLADPSRATDNRWMHRPFFDEQAAGRRHDPGTIEGRVFAGVRHLARVRAGLPCLHAGVESVPVDLGCDAVLALLRRHPAGMLLQLYNLSPDWQGVTVAKVAALGLPRPWEHLSSFAPDAGSGSYALPPYAAWWLSPR